MLIFNGRAFAKNERELDPACHGYYKRVKAGIKLYDCQRKLQAFAVVRGNNERFIVSAYPTDKGDRFMFAASSDTEKWLGLEDSTFAVERSVINNALETIK